MMIEEEKQNFIEFNIMAIQKLSLKTEKELNESILEDKAKGISDYEIGKKYGVTYKYIEKLITQSRGINISHLNNSKRIAKLSPDDFKEEQNTVWSFKQRGNWATHCGEYRGNWSPYIPRNLILKYSKPGELVLDYFCGAGTTAVECKLLGRRCIALDINEKAIELAKKNLDFSIPMEAEQITLFEQKSSFEIYEPQVLVGDARNLSFLSDNSVDLICAHPPYANIIHYTDSTSGDLSLLKMDDFLKEMFKVAEESFRVLKPGRQCAILIGDTRKEKHIIPLGFKLIDMYLKAGFLLRELIIKRQYNCKTTGFWYNKSIKYNFLLLAHEYLPIFEKPKKQESKVFIDNERLYETKLSHSISHPEFKENLDKLESTTVWIFDKDEKEEKMTANIIKRYADKNEYILVNIIQNSTDQLTHIKSEILNEDIGLLFIKSYSFKNSTSVSKVNEYLMEVSKIIDEYISLIKKGGFLIIRAKDVRVDKYIVPLAKRLYDTLTDSRLWLKEIVIVSENGKLLNAVADDESLQITHEYLLIYEVNQ